MVINNENLLRDSFEQFRTTDRFDLHKEIKIFYVGERAMDAGGIMRQWVTDLTKILFSCDPTNPELGGLLNLFYQTRSDEDISYFPNPIFKEFYLKHHDDLLSSSPNFDDYFRFAGMVLAKGIFEKIPVSVKLHPVLLKLLLGNV